MSNYLGHLVTSSMVTITTTEETLTVPADHISYAQVVSALKMGDYTYAIELADAAQAINIFGQGHVYVSDGAVMFDGTPLHNSLTSRIMSMVREGYNVEPMLMFLKNLMDNPSSRAVSELYRFLECNSLPITEDGHFLAYKKVSADYTDSYTGTIDNSVGQVVNMPRNQVMDDPNRTCSAGLHFCSIGYLKSFYGEHVMVLKINPADVVSIPVDYDNSKGRCCRYEVVAEHMDGDRDTLSEQAVYTEDDLNSAWQDGYDEGYEQGNW